MPWLVVKRKKNKNSYKKVLDKNSKVCYNIPVNERNTNMNITATYVISGKKNAVKTNPATLTVTIWKNNDVKLSEIKFVYGSKKWDTASTRDLFNFISWIGGGKTVASLEDYINAAWDYAFTCNKYAGQRARKWDIIHL